MKDRTSGRRSVTTPRVAPSTRSRTAGWIRQFGLEVKAVFPRQPVAEFGQAGRWRAACEYVKGEGPESEHVQPDPVGAAAPYSLRGLERFGPLPVHVRRARRCLAHRPGLLAGVARSIQLGDAAAWQSGHRRTAQCPRALPVTDQDLPFSAGQGPDQHRVRRQPAVNDPVVVRIGDRLGDLAHQRQPVCHRDGADLVGQPQVEPLEPLVEWVNQADAQFVLDDVHQGAAAGR